MENFTVFLLNHNACTRCKLLVLSSPLLPLPPSQSYDSLRNWLSYCECRARSSFVRRRGGETESIHLVSASLPYSVYEHVLRHAKLSIRHCVNSPPRRRDSRNLLHIRENEEES